MTDDSSALAWLVDEVQQSLDRSHKALHKSLKSAQTNAFALHAEVDVQSLRLAADECHKAVGALELAGETEGARVLRASELLIQHWVVKPHLLQAEQVQAIESLSFALVEFLQRKVAGKSVQAIALFPQYDAVMLHSGSDVARPGDLWQAPASFTVDSLLADELAETEAVALDETALSQFESGVLRLMRNADLAEAAQLSALMAGFAADAVPRQAWREANAWAMASACLEALAQARLPLDTSSKRLLAALLGQLRAALRHQTQPSDRLIRDLIFYCSQAGAHSLDHHLADHLGLLDTLRKTLGVHDLPPVNLWQPTLGLFDPAVVKLALKRLVSAKDAWSSIAGGDLMRLNGLTELVLQVSEPLRRLFPSGNTLALALTDAATHTVSTGQAPSPELAMEVATSLLYVEAALQDGDFTQEHQSERMTLLAERMDRVREFGVPEPLPQWIEALYRQVADQQSMGSVVHELRTTLHLCEQHIDQYFRDHEKTAELVEASTKLSSTKGVFSLLDATEASQAVHTMRMDLDVLLHEAEGVARDEAQERLVLNLGALGFLVDCLGVQPSAAQSLFVFNPDTGLLTSRVNQAKAFAGDDTPAVDLPVGDTDSPLDDVTATTDTPIKPTEPTQQLLTEQPPSTPVVQEFLQSQEIETDGVAETSAEPADDEMLAVFLEEADEVLSEANEALQALINAPSDIGLMTHLRRAFHTLKGSSRMVGLRAFGEASWACEQLYNAKLADHVSADEPLLAFTNEALSHLLDGVQRMAKQDVAQWDAQMLIDAANALRLEGVHMPSPLASDAADNDFADLDFDLSDGNIDSDSGGDSGVGSDIPVPLEADDTLPVQFPELTEDELRPVLPDAPDAALPEEDTAFETAFAEWPDVVNVADLDVQVDMPLPEVTQEASANDEGLDEQTKVIGPLRISIALFNIFLNEADEQSRRLLQLLGEWQIESHQPISDEVVALAHSLSGNSAAVGYEGLASLARALEQALSRCQSVATASSAVGTLFVEVAEDIRRLLHQFAAGFLRDPDPNLLVRLHDIDALVVSQESLLVEDLSESLPDDMVDVAFMADAAIADAALVDAADAAVADLGMPEFKPFAALESSVDHGMRTSAHIDMGADADIDVADAIDPDLFPVFEEEARELLSQLNESIRHWLEAPQATEHVDAAMRTLHTFKGGARLAGAMRMGELAHRMESEIEGLSSQAAVAPHDIESLLGRADLLQQLFDESLKQDIAQQAALEQQVPPVEDVPQGVSVNAEEPESSPSALPEVEQTEPSAAVFSPSSPEPSQAPTPLDWSALATAGFKPAQGHLAQDPQATGIAAVRVKPRLLDRLVNQAGEMSISRTRLANHVQDMRSSVGDLTDNLERLREQLRDIELQAETQLSTRMEAARQSQSDFDPLEFDRYTRFQELTRMMAESVNDVATVQRGLVRNLESAEDHLAEQSRLTRDLQDDLLRTRMVAFDGLSDRLYRVIRQAAKETGKQVRLDIIGGQVEVDRGVLDRMTAAFEHLLRNCVTHGIELPEQRQALGKPVMGEVVLAVRQDGNEVSIECRDDGAGLDLPRIYQKAVQAGLLDPAQPSSEAEVAQLIFTPGFSTADDVTELAGRGIGMDVVRSEVVAIGGRIETATAAGQGTSFKLVLPLTTAVTKVVMVRCGDLITSIPTHLVELVRRIPGEEVRQAYQAGTFVQADKPLPFFWLGALLQHSPSGETAGRSLPILLIRSAQQQVVLHVDEVLGNQDVVVKNLGPQLSRVPGLAGMTLRASGAIALIYNPVALAAAYGVQAQNWSRGVASELMAGAQTPVQHATAPLVLVVDDSLTVRRVTQRLLTREGYRVTLAKDGMDALEHMAKECPAMVLSDIEMPRMDGFDLVRNLRANANWAHLPIVMITSRIAQKHRDYAMELGVNHYLGKPYNEEELLRLVAHYTGDQAQVLDLTTA